IARGRCRAPAPERAAHRGERGARPARRRARDRGAGAPFRARRNARRQTGTVDPRHGAVRRDQADGAGPRPWITPIPLAWALTTRTVAFAGALPPLVLKRTTPRRRDTRTTAVRDRLSRPMRQPRRSRVTAQAVGGGDAAPQGRVAAYGMAREARPCHRPDRALPQPAARSGASRRAGKSERGLTSAGQPPPDGSPRRRGDLVAWLAHERRRTALVRPSHDGFPDPDG